MLSGPEATIAIQVEDLYDNLQNLGNRVPEEYFVRKIGCVRTWLWPGHTLISLRLRPAMLTKNGFPSQCGSV